MTSAIKKRWTLFFSALRQSYIDVRKQGKTESIFVGKNWKLRLLGTPPLCTLLTLVGDRPLYRVFRSPANYSANKEKFWGAKKICPDLCTSIGCIQLTLMRVAFLRKRNFFRNENTGETFDRGTAFQDWIRALHLSTIVWFEQSRTSQFISTG